MIMAFRESVIDLRYADKNTLPRCQVHPYYREAHAVTGVTEIFLWWIDVNAAAAQA